MPLPLPKLDNRTFDQLVAEGQLQAPRLAGAWTDHNASDPGITLVELFSWLIEMDVYRLDRVSLAMLKTFLRRLGIEQRPTQAAEAILAWRTSGAAALSLPAGIQVSGSAGLIFETDRSLVISPAALTTLLVQVGSSPAAAPAEAPFLPFGAQPAPGNALHIGFDRLPGAAGQEVSLYCWTTDPAGDRLVRQRLEAEWQAQAADMAAADCQNSGPVTAWQEHYRARVVWEYYSTGLGDWAALPGVVDETRALTLSGGVRFNLPADMGADQPQPGAWFIRCRLTSGGYECLPQLARVAHNAGLARHAAQQPVEGGSLGEELLGVSSGAAGQAFTCKRSPVIPGSFELRVATSTGSQTWAELPDLERAGPHSKAFALNDARDALLAGNGRSGRVPPAGAEIWARYKVGGGESGNLAAHALDRPLPGLPNTDLAPGWAGALPSLSVEQPYPALGGSDAEPLESVQGRALDMLATSQRAVTMEDLVALAQETPGAPVARARALPNYYPYLPCVPAPGCVTLVVVAACPSEWPEPSPELLRAIQRYIQRRLPLTTELHVIGPTFLPVRVTARLHITPGGNGDQVFKVFKQALDRLNAFLNPLNGGPDLTGWPVGRDVYRSEVMALLHEVSGVAHVSGLGLQGPEDAQPRCGNLPVCPDGLVTPGRHSIEIVTDSPARGNVRASKGVCDDE